MPQLSARGRIVRDALIYTPLFLLCLTGVILLLLSFDRPWIGIVLLGFVTFLFGFQSVQSLRDLTSTPRETTGTISRRWTKRDAMIAKRYYVTVERAIFRIPVDAYLGLREKDTVRIVAYPHTGTVVSVERTGR